MTTPSTPLVPHKPRAGVKTYLIIGAIVVFTVATVTPALGGIELNFAAIAANWRNGANKLLHMLQPNFAFCLARGFPCWKPCRWRLSEQSCLLLYPCL